MCDAQEPADEVVALSALQSAIRIGGSFDPRCLFNPVMIRRIDVGSRTGFEAMNRAISVHRLQPAIDCVFRFAEAKEACRYFADRRHVGKVVISGD
jgi:NADPH:quinone reductase-like Zn-dependent oxidoreductase